MNKRIGIIDIGSNSVRLLLADIGENNSIRIINELKEYLRLGAGLDKNKFLSEEKIQLCLDTLATYKNICSAFEVSEITAVATEAVRSAKNQKEFLDTIENNIELKINVLTGTEEAYYDYFSTINSMNIDNALIMDIGGASTELILVKNRELVNSISVPFGAINLIKQFGINDVLEKDQETDLKTFLTEQFNKLEWLKEAKGFTLIGIGGSIRTLGKIHRKSVDYPLNLMHNYHIKNTDVISIYNLVKTKTNAQRKKIKGLSSDRADIFVGAAAAIETLIDLCSIEDIIISRNGIREGLLYSHICKNNVPVENVLDFSINTILINHHSNIDHAKHIYHLMNSLYHGLSSLVKSSFNLERIIKTSAMLHDIGSNITYYFHHKHSLYMILNSQINGISHKELVMSACIAAGHRDDNFPINYSEYKILISKEDITIIKNLGLLLRISESLDRSMISIVKDVECTIDKDTVIIKTISDKSPDIEIKEALNSTEDFKNQFEKKLYIV
ncbi:exopolyphosphatase [Clostridium pasteurianum DSM 525 = ATCC 6013]|uniref:Exopolyphosphatase n=1 Tax=Clostridium pasteurianum DSM 525 = ATCC 6013 TaxID=1262449 RepID=A0A0H3J1B5_CLOPA|nr:exopolyphosphatase [Clostridium pasteurianum]AJA47651.1 exopolyphosphatase [Clostridium pasteurianum DSM 525 = ATCC 6013]AJA51639.1 exopolyphosphatase [Clostridium pasteurianum DSM 525 = ATCC 6013]AOZ74958.1 exopolyphosphatase [Clostridium pasteurianum DSM 525 = ATCC 6013]AOZ78753.1 exopolyphosphatase [Clostridium pasteurianum]ELP58010.1 Exopolyphosphatase [Clostridium pasteurianum DSM 525 = ATCC 6013]